ncbi:MAG: type II toxin-antitoxin system VapC family toxin [Chloroflexota bacterium]|nr:type II toxin-antitoxin system VapC family toxin [Chloroflexota bacterium]MDE2896192.1 type II toxin-antitoxin system VapC family toxin [Chloroflexota bacterium]
MNEAHLYLDTSAVAKLLIREERDADVAAELVARSDVIQTSLLTYPETMSALTRARRDRRLSDQGLQDALDRFGMLWPRFEVVQFSERIAFDAAAFILEFPLSGADAVQIASALSIPQDLTLTLATWDRRQADAARSIGLTVQPAID